MMTDAELCEQQADEKRKREGVAEILSVLEENIAKLKGMTREEREAFEDLKVAETILTAAACLHGIIDAPSLYFDNRVEWMTETLQVYIAEQRDRAFSLPAATEASKTDDDDFPLTREQFGSNVRGVIQRWRLMKEAMTQTGDGLLDDGGSNG